jgi:hypothetical protein
MQLLCHRMEVPQVLAPHKAAVLRCIGADFNVTFGMLQSYSRSDNRKATNWR